MKSLERTEVSSMENVLEDLEPVSVVLRRRNRHNHRPHRPDSPDSHPRRGKAPTTLPGRICTKGSFSRRSWTGCSKRKHTWSSVKCLGCTFPEARLKRGPGRAEQG